MKTNFIFGRKNLQDALNNNLSISHVYLKDYDNSFIPQLKIKRIPYSFKDNIFFNNLTKEKKHQNIAFIFLADSKLIFFILPSIIYIHLTYHLS